MFIRGKNRTHIKPMTSQILLLRTKQKWVAMLMNLG